MMWGVWFQRWLSADQGHVLRHPACQPASQRARSSSPPGSDTTAFRLFMLFIDTQNSALADAFLLGGHFSFGPDSRARSAVPLRRSRAFWPTANSTSAWPLQAPRTPLDPEYPASMGSVWVLQISRATAAARVCKEGVITASTDAIGALGWRINGFP